jgi:hypothetical protein
MLHLLGAITAGPDAFIAFTVMIIGIAITLFITITR